MSPTPVSFTVAEEDAGNRLDAYLTRRLPEFSRTYLRRAISGGSVLVDSTRAKPAYRLVSGQVVTVQELEIPREGPEPEDIPLEVLYEDEHLVAINKPPAMVVHPAKGHWSGTLTAALAHRFESLSGVGGASRPGIVHRLDRDTSGVIVVARTDQAHLGLARQFEHRTVRKTYCAITRGMPDRDRDQIDLPIGPHPHHREKKAIRVDHPDSRPAVTQYEVQERFTGFAIVHAFPKTGRTHQIRLHLAHAGIPVLCDRLYASHARLTTSELRLPGESVVLLERQALHAMRLELEHPITQEPLELSAPIPSDMQRVIEVLRDRERSLA